MNQFNNRGGYGGGVVQLLIGATMISFSPVFVKLADIGPTPAGFYRQLFGGIFLVVVVVVRRESLWRGRTPLLLAVAAGLLFAADLTCWHRSINYIGPGLATIMGNFQVFFLAAFGVAVAHERVDWKLLVSIPLAMLGLFLLVGVDWNQLHGEYRLGVWLGLATAVTYSGYLLVLRYSQSRERRLPAVSNLCIVTLLTAAIMGVETIVEGDSFVIPNIRSWVSMIAYGVICQGLGWIIISRALVKVPASRVGLILLLQPTLSFVWDIWFFGRPTTVLDVTGATIALGAIYLGGTRPREKTV